MKINLIALEFFLKLKTKNEFTDETPLKFDKRNYYVLPTTLFDALLCIIINKALKKFTAVNFK